jgi:hypothetical protein
MFARPTGDATAAVQAVTLAQDAFLAIVGRIVEHPALPVAGLLFATAHGIADLELSGHLPPDKWGVDGDGIIDLLVRTISN